MIKLCDIAREFNCDSSNFKKWITRNLPQICLKVEYPMGSKSWMIHEKDIDQIGRASCRERV
jgi:hypothetical protein